MKTGAHFTFGQPLTARTPAALDEAIAAPLHPCASASEVGHGTEPGAKVVAIATQDLHLATVATPGQLVHVEQATMRAKPGCATERELGARDWCSITGILQGRNPTYQ